MLRSMLKVFTRLAGGVVDVLKEQYRMDWSVAAFARGEYRVYFITDETQTLCSSYAEKMATEIAQVGSRLACANFRAERENGDGLEHWTASRRVATLHRRAGHQMAEVLAC
jgi:hypothetical protein